MITIYRSQSATGCPPVKDYLVNNKTVVVFFADGTKTFSTCGEEDTFCLETGFINCIMKRVFGDHFYSDVRKCIKNVDASKANKKKEAERIAQEKKDFQERCQKRHDRNIERIARLEKEIEEAKKRMKK